MPEVEPISESDRSRVSPECQPLPRRSGQGNGFRKPDSLRAALNLVKSTLRFVIHAIAEGETSVSIIRVGLAETKKFSDGWEAIFGKKSGSTKQKAPKAAARKAGGKKKKKTAKKK